MQLTFPLTPETMTSREIEPMIQGVSLQQQKVIKLEPVIKPEKESDMKQEICSCCAGAVKGKTELLVKIEGVSCDICKKENVPPIIYMEEKPPMLQKEAVPTPQDLFQLTKEFSPT